MYNLPHYQSLALQLVSAHCDSRARVGAGLVLNDQMAELARYRGVGRIVQREREREGERERERDWS